MAKLWVGQAFEVLLLPAIPEKRVGTRSKFSPPPTFNVDNQGIFSLFVETQYFPTLIRGEGGYVISWLSWQGFQSFK